jgi:uncharacterized protein
VIYLDTSVLGALFFREPTAPAILARLETVGKDDLCVSAWNLAEMASVGAIKERTGSIDAADRAAGLAAFNRFVSDSLRLAEVEPGDFRAAIVLLDRPALALRAGDVLHLASSAAYGPAWRLWMRANRWPPITTASPFLGCLDLLGKCPLANGRLRP